MAETTEEMRAGRAMELQNIRNKARRLVEEIENFKRDSVRDQWGNVANKCELAVLGVEEAIEYLGKIRRSDL